MYKIFAGSGQPRRVSSDIPVIPMGQTTPDQGPISASYQSRLYCVDGYTPDGWR